MHTLRRLVAGFSSTKNSSSALTPAPKTQSFPMRAHLASLAVLQFSSSPVHNARVRGEACTRVAFCRALRSALRQLMRPLAMP